MDLEPFKNKDSSIYKKEKIRFIWARIKLSIYNEIKRIRALPQVTIYANFGRRKRTLHLYVVTATNLVLKFRLRANAETSHSVRIGPGGGCERCGRWWKIFRWWDLENHHCWPFTIQPLHCSPTQGTCTIQHGYTAFNSIPWPPIKSINDLLY